METVESGKTYYQTKMVEGEIEIDGKKGKIKIPQEIPYTLARELTVVLEPSDRERLSWWFTIVVFALFVLLFALNTFTFYYFTFMTKKTPPK